MQLIDQCKFLMADCLLFSQIIPGLETHWHLCAFVNDGLVSMVNDNGVGSEERHSKYEFGRPGAK